MKTLKTVITKECKKCAPVVFYSISKATAKIESDVDAQLKKFLSNYLAISEKDNQAEEKKQKSSSKNKVHTIYHPEYVSVILACVSDEGDSAQIQKLGGIIGKYLLNAKETEFEVFPPKSKTSPLNKHINEFWYGINKAFYQITKATSEKKDTKKPGKNDQKTIYFLTSDQSFSKTIKEGESVIEGINLARDIANEPGNKFTPEDFRNECEKISQQHKYEFTALSEKEMEKLGMGCFMAVTKGSSLPAYLNIMKYIHSAKAKTLLLVGKGLTFDSGGYSLKPPSSMDGMKFDMCGGAAVLGVMKAIGFLKPKMNIVAMIPSSENLINGQAVKPGDIHEAYNSKTVEIVNTDAEGRLILCDSIAYGVEKYKPDFVIDLATLTGACMIALGKYNAGLMSDNDELAEHLLASSKRTGDAVWRLPLGQEYNKDLESPYADLKNVGSRYGGAITAACFLREFTNGIPWAHLDIAGIAMDVKNIEYYPSVGATGFGVHLIIDSIMNNFSLSS